MIRPIRACAIAALCGALLSVAVLASPEGAEWATADKPDGCRSCHLSNDPPIDSPALSLAGLPEKPAAGRPYELAITLEDPQLKNAGFLLIIRTEGSPAGTLATSEADRVEVNGTMARSTWAGSLVETPGLAEWHLNWTAPAEFNGALDFELWGNAGNRDLSPLEDRVYHRIWTISP